MPPDDDTYTSSPTIQRERQQPEKLSAQGMSAVREYSSQLSDRLPNLTQTDAEKAAAYWRGLAAAEDRRQASATLEQKQDLARKPTLGL